LILTGVGYPEYSSKKSKRTYSDHAKVGLLVVMEYLGRSFTEFSRLLPSLTGVMKAAGIDTVPDESTLRKFRKRLDPNVLDKVLAYQSRMITGTDETTVGIDATGFSTAHASRHYVMRLRQFGTEDTVMRGFTKATFASCVHTKAILTADTAGSRVADIKRLEPVLDILSGSGRVGCVLADKGYDAEYAHIMIRERLGAEAIIPARENAPKKGTKRHRTTGKNRSRMKRELKDTDKKARYNMRSICETVNSMVKRVLGEVLDGRTEGARHSEVMFRCIAHNFRVGMELSSSGMFV